MQYIWEVVLAARKSGIAEKDLQYREAQIRSPYLEISFVDLNTQSVEQNVIEVNPFYRFQDLFCELLDINNIEYEKTKELYVDAVFHYLAMTDLRMGMTRRDYYLLLLTGELEDGQFGRRAKDAIQLFSPVEKKYIVLSLLDLVQSGSHFEIFKSLFCKIYSNAILYVSQDRANELFLYVGRKKTIEETQRVTFLIDTFLPLSMRTEIFYADHFGILDVEETMVLDRTLLI